MLPLLLRSSRRCVRCALVTGTSAEWHGSFASPCTWDWALATACMPEKEFKGISTCSTVMMGHRRHRESMSRSEQAEQLILRSVSVDELAQAVSQLVLEDSALLLKAMRQVLKTVHLPVPPSQAAHLYPVLDKLTSAAEHHLPQLSLEDVTKAISVCRMVRFAPDGLLEALTRHLEIQGRRGQGLSTARPQDVAELLCCVAAMGSPSPQLAPMLAEACARHAHQLDCRALASTLQALASMLTRTAQDPASPATPHRSATAPRPATITTHSQGEPWQHRLASELCIAMLPQLNQAGPKELFQIASALAQLPRTAHSAALVTRLHQTAIKSLPTLPGRQLTSFARACAQHGQPNLRLARALVDDARGRLDPQRGSTPTWGWAARTADTERSLSPSMVHSIVASARALGWSDNMLLSPLVDSAGESRH